MKQREQGLERFVYAQSRSYDSVLMELRKGRKNGHWMWFVFPQIRGLGRSVISSKFAIRDQEEAEDYLKHSILGNNLIECTQMVLSHYNDKKIYHIFDGLDVHKFQACMTLFASVSAAPSVFHNALDAYFDGRDHRLTIDLLE